MAYLPIADVEVSPASPVEVCITSILSPSVLGLVLPVILISTSFVPAPPSIEGFMIREIVVVAVEVVSRGSGGSVEPRVKPAE